MSHVVIRQSADHTPGGGASGFRRLRILHLLVPAQVGGLEQVVISLAAMQASAGHDVHIALVLEPGKADHPMQPQLTAAGAQVYALVLPPRHYLREQRLIRELCTTLQPDVVHTHGARSDVLHSAVARRLRIPTVSTAHGFCGGDWKNRVYERLQRRAQRACDGVVAVSPPMAAHFREAGVAANRLHCIPNAWAGHVSFQSRGEARRALKLPQDVFCVGFVGRIGAEKGPDVLHAAVAQLGDDCHAAFLGEGRLRPALEARTRELNLSGRVHWLGIVRDAGSHLRAFDAVVLSSRTEGTPVVLLEAMAAGVPVIATHVGGIPYVVSADEAFLVPPEDAAALAAAIKDVMTGHCAAAQRAARASERLLRERDAATWQRQYDRVYETCGAGAAGSRSNR